MTEHIRPVAADTDEERIAELCAELIEWGVRRVHVLAWRDLDDLDAGGSERHADEFMRRWAANGLDIVHRTSAAVGLPARGTRHGYRIVRRGGRMTVYPRVVASEAVHRMGRYDALVEVWNGVPWLSPLWCHKPRIVVLHHVHGPMWDQILPWPASRMGRALESRIAPPWYRRTDVVTPSSATRDELLALGFRSERVRPVDNGVDEHFTPDPAVAPWPQPTVVAVGRMAPVKRFGLLLEAAATARELVPDLQLRLVGDGPMLVELEAWITENDASDWVHLLGHLDRERLRDEYRKAWLVSSASLAEGWGLTLTEAAACGTPAVATDISGHRCSVIDGTTGLLAEPSELGATIAKVLNDRELRTRLAGAAEARARSLTWAASARGTLEVLHRATARHRQSRGA